MTMLVAMMTTMMMVLMMLLPCRVSLNLVSSANNKKWISHSSNVKNCILHFILAFYQKKMYLVPLGLDGRYNPNIFIL